LAQSAAPIAPEALSLHHQLVLTDPSGLTHDREFGVVSTPGWRLADMGAKHALLRAGLGWGFMPEWMVAADLEAGGLYAVYREDLPPGPAGEWLMRRLVLPHTAP